MIPSALRPPRVRLALAISLLAFVILAAALAILHGRGERATGPLRQEGYLWQRQAIDNGDSPGPPVLAAARRAGLSGVVALAAEASLAAEAAGRGTPGRSAGNPQVRVAIATIPLPRSAPASGDSVLAGRAGSGERSALGLAVRLGPLAGGFGTAPAAAERVIELARDAVARARAMGWSAAEVQIDFDCAESGLDDYALLVRRVHRAVAPVPVIITAVPSWMTRRAAFGRLIAAADGFVLQVHSLARPAGIAAPLVLCDPAAARAAVETAARWRRPFRVALPTYGYTVAFDVQGAFVGLAAEGPALRWPPGTRWRTVRAEPEAMAGLVQDWTRDRPRELSGILWYRLPAPGDRLNWRWSTLRAVAAGRAPRHDLRLARLPTPGGGGQAAALADIVLINAGEADEPWPAAVRIHWQPNRLIAADGLAGYRVRDLGPADATLAWQAAGAASPPAASPRPFLPPGSRIIIGWLRFAAAAELRLAAAPSARRMN